MGVNCYVQCRLPEIRARTSSTPPCWISVLNLLRPSTSLLLPLVHVPKCLRSLCAFSFLGSVYYRLYHPTISEPVYVAYCALPSRIGNGCLIIDSHLLTGCQSTLKAKHSVKLDWPRSSCRSPGKIAAAWFALPFLGKREVFRYPFILSNDFFHSGFSILRLLYFCASLPTESMCFVEGSTNPKMFPINKVSSLSQFVRLRRISSKSFPYRLCPSIRSSILMVQLLYCIIICTPL